MVFGTRLDEHRRDDYPHLLGVRLLASAVVANNRAGRDRGLEAPGCRIELGLAEWLPLRVCYMRSQARGRIFFHQVGLHARPSPQRTLPPAHVTTRTSTRIRVRRAAEG